MESTSLPSEFDEPIDGVRVAQLVAGDTMSTQYFEIEPGATVPEHQHEHEQVGIVWEGELQFSLRDEVITVPPGGTYLLTSNEPHAATNVGTETIRGLDVFSPPRLGAFNE